MSKFGERIRQCRIEADKTLHSAADLLGVSALCLEQVELGKRPPFSRARIETLAAFYGVDSEPLTVAAWRERGLIELDMAHAPSLQIKAIWGIVCGGLSEDQWEQICQVVNRTTREVSQIQNDASKASVLVKAAGSD